MRIIGGSVSVCIVLFFYCHTLAQELSTVVIPSEDELIEALRQGEISYYQFLILQEIAENGIDSTSQYLLDEVPNLAWFRPVDTSMLVPLEEDQRAGFASGGGENTSTVSAVLRHRQYQRLEEGEESWYRTSGDIRWGDRYRFNYRINRETNGAERLVGRTFQYRRKDGFIRQVDLGSFITRCGLGTAFGYRGKLMAFSREFDSESILFPDCGGYNGIRVEGAVGSYKYENLASIVRDSTHSLTSAAAMFRHSEGSWRPGVIVGLNRLKNRQTGESVSFSAVGLYNRYLYGAGHLDVELSRQSGNGSHALSGVIEGRHRFAGAEIRYAAWTYGDDAVALTTGSKAASLTVADTIETVDFTFSSRRRGQEGLLVKTVVELAHALKFENSLLYAEVDVRRRNRQYSSTLISRCSPRLQLELGYLGTWEKRTSSGSFGDRNRHRFRLQARFNSGLFSCRSYIGLDAENQQPNNVSLFTTVRYRFPGNGEIEAWSNLGEIDSNGVQYWYFFVRGKQQLMERLEGAVKLIHSYRRDSKDSHSATVSLELIAKL